ncbi:MAG TPA: AAA family ATPase [Thermoplasmata archaeon]|nr:AAA family ATPase [Thermoplasmata archaeon]
MAVGAGGRPWIGRLEAVEALHRRFEDARAGSGGVTLLVGDTGVGKSTLVGALVQDMRRRGVRVLEGRAPAVDAPPPFALIRAALEGAREPAGAGLAEEMPAAGAPAAFLIGFAPRLDDGVLSAPVRIEDRLISALETADERREAIRDPIWSGIAEQFHEFTRRGPTVLVLEDLHRADPMSLEAVEYLARQLQNRPLWILGTVRPLSSLPSSRRARLEEFENRTRARRIVLRPLTSDEVADYLRDREPGRPFTPEEVARRYSETGGNPLLLEQLDRRLRVPNAPPLVQIPGDVDVEPTVPPLDQEEDRTLAVASVIGPELSFQLLLRASGEDEERLAEAIDRLVGRGLLFERPGELLTFADDRLRENVYRGLTESRRRLLHRRVGEALEATGSADIATIYALARHFYLGKVDEKSLQYNRTAAELADRSFSPETAREHLERALESFRRLKPDDWEGEMELVLELAQQIDHVGQLKEAEELLRHHLARRGLASRLPTHVLALLELYLARIQTDRGEWRAAAETTARLLALPELTDHPAILLGVHHLHGETLYYEGRYTEALEENAKELDLARATQNERALARGQVRRANALGMLGRSDQAMVEARAAAGALERLGDLREAAFAHLFLGVVISGQGTTPQRWTEAITEFAEAVRLAEKAHDLRRVGWALFNTADILREAGELDQAAEKNARSREILERIGDRFGLVQALIIQGKILHDRGEYDRAEAELLEAYRIVRELKAPADEVDVVLRLAQLSYARGDRANARRRVQELERQNLPALRPDVAADFERLKRALRTKEGEKTDGPAE